MIKKFLNGLVFGFGFCIAVFVGLTIWLNVVDPIKYEGKGSFASGSSEQTTVKPDNKYPMVKNFNELSLDQKIEYASAILTTSISKDESGQYQVKVQDILKKPEDVSLYYEIGDQYDHHMDFKKMESEGSSAPKGFIVFFNGNPAVEKYSFSYSGERIYSLGNITLEQLKEKCRS